MLRPGWKPWVLVALGLGAASGESIAQEAPVSRNSAERITGREDSSCKGDDLVALARWFTCHHIKVRESFESEQAEKKPAVIAFDSGNSEADYYKVDVGVRFRANQLFESLLWYPTVELHRSTAEKEPINKKSAALKLEYYPSPGDATGGGLPRPVRRIKPFFLLEGKATRDSQAHQTVGSASLLTSFRTSGQFAFPGPGQGVRCGSAKLVCFRYRPYFGIEHFNRLKVGPEGATSDFDGSFAVGKVGVEIYPIPLETFRPLEILMEGQYRNRLNSNDAVKRETYSWSAQLNWYLDEAQSIAIGVDYEDGRSPDNNFVYGHRYGIALKFKLNTVD